MKFDPSLKAQYGSLAGGWHSIPDPPLQQNLKFFEETEPSISFHNSDLDAIIFTLKSSGLFYNREQFPNHTAEYAAQLVANTIKTSCKYENSFDIKLRPFKEFQERHFCITKQGSITHNFEVDTWHWWFLDYLAKFMKMPL
jgi:hypothetical protein